MDNRPTEMKEAPYSLCSECDETEPDGDSVWSGGSVSASEGGTDSISSVGSPLRDLPTVRAKEDGDNEIQRLIHAAEALVLERARLKISRSIISPAPMDSPAAGGAEATTSTLVPSRMLHGETFSDNRCGAASSGYFTDTENAGQASCLSSTLSGEKSVNLDIYGEKEQHSVQSRESLSSTACDSIILSKVSDSSIKGCDYLQPENVMPAENPTSIPRLSLKPLMDPDCRRTVGVPEERLAINKIEKEACNSSIRGSSGNSRPPQKEIHARILGEDNTPGPLHAVVGGQAASVMVHEEGSCLVNLALNATSSLKRLTRLMRQVGALQLGPDTPRVSETVLHELEQHEAHQQDLETKLTTAATQLQTAVAHVHGLEVQQQEHQHQAEATHHSALALLEQVEAGLESCGLNHMLVVTSPRRRCSARVLEDVGSAVALLVGELSRRTQRLTRAEEEASHLRKELQGVRDVLTQRDSWTRLSEAEARQVKQQSEEDLTSLRQCLAQAEENLTEAHLENAKLSEETNRQASENSAALSALQLKLCEAQAKAETRVNELERDLHLSSKEKQRLQATVGELKDQLTLRTQQMHVVEEENSLLVESLRSALRQQQGEVEQVRQHLESANIEKSHLSHSLAELRQGAATKEEELEEAKEKTRQLNRKVTELEQEQRETQKTLQDKVDSLSSERGELETKVRAQELAILQLRTELEMEKVQTRALTEEAAALGKKAKDLQERLWMQSRRHNSSGGNIGTTDPRHQQQLQLGTGVNAAYNGCISLPHSPGAPLLTSPKVGNKDVGSLAREEQLQSLLREKDVELQNLHHSLSSQIISKNQELEMLSNKLVGLEEQLCTLMKGLEASAVIGDISSEVGQLLQERTQHLDSLQQSSHWLQDELSSLALENQTLSTELVSTRRMEKDSLWDAKESVRSARQEAREERVASAHLREECSRLQAQLDLAQHTLHQERQERRMSAVVNSVKHQEFSNLMESATAALNHYKP